MPSIDKKLVPIHKNIIIKYNYVDRGVLNIVFHIFVDSPSPIKTGQILHLAIVPQIVLK